MCVNSYIQNFISVSYSSVFKYNPRGSEKYHLCYTDIQDLEIIPQPREKMNKVFRRKVLDHITSPKYTHVYIPIVYPIHIILGRTSGRRTEDPPTKCKNPVLNLFRGCPRRQLSFEDFPRNVHANLSLRTLGDALAGPAPGLSVARSVCNTHFIRNTVVSNGFMFH